MIKITIEGESIRDLYQQFAAMTEQLSTAPTKPVSKSKAKAPDPQDLRTEYSVLGSYITGSRR